MPSDTQADAANKNTLGRAADIDASDACQHENNVMRLPFDVCAGVVSCCMAVCSRHS